MQKIVCAVSQVCLLMVQKIAQYKEANIRRPINTCWCLTRTVQPKKNKRQPEVRRGGGGGR